jgi:hypothetical protein
VLLFYTLLITLPALQLFMLCKRGVPGLRFILPLKAGIAILGLVLFLGVMALPREAESDASRIAGTWVKAEERPFGKPEQLTLTKGGSATIDLGGFSPPPASFNFDGKVLKIKAEGMTGEFKVDFVSDNEIVLVADDVMSRSSPLAGRWKRKGGSGSSKDRASKDLPELPLKDGDDDDKPNLDSPLAPKLVGKWKGTDGKTKDHMIEFTKAGKAMFTYSDRARPAGEMTLGTYSFTKDSVIQLKRAGDSRFEKGWRVDIEFVGDDDILLVNHGTEFGGFGPLRGRYQRSR